MGSARYLGILRVVIEILFLLNCLVFYLFEFYSDIDRGADCWSGFFANFSNNGGLSCL